MDGSIADTTMLRMRSGLSRAYQPAANSTANDFFEELLRLPVASTTSVEDKPQPATPDPTELTAPSDANGSPIADEVSAEDKSTAEDSKSEPSQPMALGCYVPWQPIAPVVDTDVEPTTGTDVETQPVPTLDVLPVTNQPATKTDDAISQLPVKPVIAEQTTTTSLTPSEEVVQPVPAADSVKQASQLSVARDVRRIKPRDEKATQPTEPTQPERQTAKPPITAEHHVDDKPVISQTQTVTADQATDTKANVHTESKADARSEEPRSETRDKWYEHQDDNVTSQVHELLSAQTSDDATSDQANAGNQSALDTASNPDTQVQADQAILTDAMGGGSGQLELAQAAATTSLNNQAPSATESRTSTSGTSAVGANGGAGRANHTNSIGATLHNTSGVRSSTGSATTSEAGRESSADEIESRQLTQQERVRLVQRVARSFSRLGPDGGQVSLKLHPPQLGVLNVSIKIEGQSMTARLQTESGAARDVILENLPVLKERLSEQGIEVEKFQVEVATSEEFTSGSQSQTNDSASGSGGSSRDRQADLDAFGNYRRNSRTLQPPTLTERSTIESVRMSGWPDRSLDVKA